tara:strand:+ start:275 stop:478 length:204 start_codon:yes stop_codon:yes gene_type:complete
MIGTHNTLDEILQEGEDIDKAEKKLKSAIRLVLKELNHRLPKTSHDGFMPEQKLLDAMQIIKDSLGK